MALTSTTATAQADQLTQQLQGLNNQLSDAVAAGDNQLADSIRAQIAIVNGQLAALNTPASNGAPTAGSYIADLIPSASDIGGAFADLGTGIGNGVKSLLGGITPTLVLVLFGVIVLVGVAGASGALKVRR